MFPSMYVNSKGKKLIEGVRKRRTKVTGRKSSYIITEVIINYKSNSTITIEQIRKKEIAKGKYCIPPILNSVQL
jgi:hypothetical protein